MVKRREGSWHGVHMDRPSSRRWFEKMSSEAFAAQHHGEGAEEYLQGYADALEDLDVLSHDGARAFRAALALGGTNRGLLGGSLSDEDVGELLREARMWEPEEYCELNGVACGSDAADSMRADMEHRMLATAATRLAGACGEETRNG